MNDKRPCKVCRDRLGLEDVVEDDVLHRPASADSGCRAPQDHHEYQPLPVDPETLRRIIEALVHDPRQEVWMAAQDLGNALCYWEDDENE